MPTPIETNTATMQALLEKIAGKAAGGGGAVETCTVELTDGGHCGGVIYQRPDRSIVYLDGWGGFVGTSTFDDVAVGSQFITLLADRPDDVICSENATLLSVEDNNCFAYTYTFRIDGNCSINNSF